MLSHSLLSSSPMQFALASWTRSIFQLCGEMERITTYNKTQFLRKQNSILSEISSLTKFDSLSLLISFLHFSPLFSQIMHLWPSLRLRDSFKRAYLEKLDLNLHRMKRSKASPATATTAPLLSDKSNGCCADFPSDEEGSTKSVGLLLFCHDIFMLLTCCCCCFCCGGMNLIFPLFFIISLHNCS